jgi:hypothetical protein
MEITLFLKGYDSTTAYNSFVDELKKFVLQWVEVIAATADANIRYYPQLKGTIQSSVMEMVDSVVGEVFPEGPNAWQGWLEQWGKGSLLDSNNPGLSDYMNSDSWNPERESYIIVGRSAGTYKSFDGKERYSSGRKQGQIIEDINSQQFKPTPPSHFMTNALESNRLQIMESLQQLVTSFDWGAFFIMK